MTLVMRCILLLSVLCSGLAVRSQKVIKQAVVKSILYTQFVGSDAKPTEVELTTWFKSPNLKVFQKNEYANNTVYIDRVTEKITTLYETMGKKIGFFIFDSTNEAKQKIWDSIEVVYIDSSRNINNFMCKEAIMKFPKVMRQKDVEVWYDPDFVFDDRNMGLNIYGINKIHGAAISFRALAANNMMVEYKITSVDTATLIDDNLFQIPDGFDIRTAKAFQAYMNKLRATN
jgi:hypothetical protein